MRAPFAAQMAVVRGSGRCRRWRPLKQPIRPTPSVTPDLVRGPLRGEGEAGASCATLAARWTPNQVRSDEDKVTTVPRPKTHG